MEFNHQVEKDNKKDNETWEEICERIFGKDDLVYQKVE
jgi:hypothetical protein